MDLGPSLIADEQPFEVVEVGEVRSTTQRTRPSPEPCSVWRRAMTGVMPCLRSSSRWRSGRSRGRRPRSRASVGVDRQRRRRWDHRNERKQLLDVVAVRAGQAPGKRYPAGIDEEMVLRPWTAPIDRARARLGAPFFARIWLESTTARDHSISPAARSLDRSSTCSRSQTPARCHSSSRRQQVTPEPKPSSAADATRRSPCATQTGSLQRLAVGQPLSTRIPKPPLLPRKQRFHQLPQLVGDDPRRDSHRYPSSLTTDTDGVRRHRTGPFILKRLLKTLLGKRHRRSCSSDDSHRSHAVARLFTHHSVEPGSHGVGDTQRDETKHETRRNETKGEAP